MFALKKLQYATYLWSYMRVFVSIFCLQSEHLNMFHFIQMYYPRHSYLHRTFRLCDTLRLSVVAEFCASNA